MVALTMNLVPKKAWLAGVAARLGVAATPDPASDSFGGDANQRLGILSFEVARTMSRLVLLYRALTEEYIGRLRGSTIRAEGVAYLNSSEPLFLLRAACAELVEDLDQAAASISRLAARCHLNWPRSFDLVYSEIKSGSGDFVLGFPSKDLSKKLRKMERYVASTSVLHEEMETLAELEASERNLERWRHYSGPIIGGAPAPAPAPVQQADPPGADLLMRKLAEQKRLVRKLKEESLWVRSFDRVADLMSRTVVALFARVCSIFSSIVVDLPLVVFERDGRFKFAVNRRHHNPHQPYFSGPLERPQASHAFVGSSGPIFRPGDRTGENLRPWTSQYLDPPAGTVGESGLSLRYADVVVLAEEMLQSPQSAGKDARKELYQLLPTALRKAVKTKLRRPEARRGGGGDDGMAAGWRDATGRILEWLGPMAHDTVRWHSERSCERQKFVPSSQGKVLLLQTLHFANREKTEAAIVEVLVGLSCAFRYQRRTFACVKKEEDENDDDDDDWSFNL